MNTPPEPRFHIEISGKEKSVFMSFALLNTMSAYFENKNEFEEILTNPTVRSSMLIEMLSDRDETGRIIKELDLNHVEIETDKVLDILEWAAEHIEYFFTQALQRASQRMKKKANLTT